MKVMGPKLKSLMVRLASWYGTPAGFVSFALIAVVVVLAALGLAIPAVLVTVAWIAVLVPHKLTAERDDWTAALEESLAAVDARITESSDQVAYLEERTRRLTSELSMTPTAEEISTWQQGVEAAQGQANARVRDRLNEVSARVDELAATEEQREIADTSISATVDGIEPA